MVEADQKDVNLSCCSREVGYAERGVDDYGGSQIVRG